MFVASEILGVSLGIDGDSVFDGRVVSSDIPLFLLGGYSNSCCYIFRSESTTSEEKRREI